MELAMHAFEKFGQKYLNKINGYILALIVFTVIGWISFLLLSFLGDINIFQKVEFISNLVVQGTGALIFFLYLRKIFSAYMDQKMFTHHTLGLVINLAKLMMLLAIVIEPGFYTFLEIIQSFQQEDKKTSGILLFLEHINIALFAAGYALHLISTAHKVARHIEEEQDLTV
jgi:hypothetical protein